MSRGTVVPSVWVYFCTFRVRDGKSCTQQLLDTDKTTHKSLEGQRGIHQSALVSFSARLCLGTPARRLGGAAG